MTVEPLTCLECRNAQFLDASNSSCNEVWREWPSIQTQAIFHDTFFVFELFPSVGNLFLTFFDILPVRSLLLVSRRRGDLTDELWGSTLPPLQLCIRKRLAEFCKTLDFGELDKISVLTTSDLKLFWDYCSC